MEGKCGRFVSCKASIPVCDPTPICSGVKQGGIAAYTRQGFASSSSALQVFPAATSVASTTVVVKHGSPSAPPLCQSSAVAWEGH